MSELHLGAQLYTVREKTRTAEDFMSTVKNLSDMGYRYMQVSGVGADVTPDVIREAVDTYGIKCVLTHSPLGRIINETDEIIAEHKSFGCDAIGIGGIANMYPHTADGYAKFALDIAPAVEKIKDAGMKFLYHNHRFEFEHYEDGTGLDILMSMTDPEGVYFTFDVYWSHVAGIDPADFIRRHGERIFCTHLKDMTVRDDKLYMTECLTGNLNFDAIVSASLDAGVKYHMIEQDDVYIDLFDSMRISHDNLKARYPEFRD
ncbi:MAG: sugar phosphate isomerase/epimerase [Firmicutes bacterium]|nr:sugar phosphate isomerase/epimerase [Bacillota bacterium]MCD7783619.1 sugar phosphate isomerase/epimerase [Bacillota bacterium]MCD7788902.1 sugar phosphate isomerase/epimerase [Bacillota bacterium]MCD7832118.1 sugar phosphate isomerase/epimerase [Bacillota bacterium]MCD8312122.1 sugar phosphate isomerase/epimerase [Bacillota bacterium]